MTMTKENRAQAVNAVSETLRGLIDARKVVDAKLAEGGRKRSEKYLAFFATAKFADAVVDNGFDLKDLFERCDKTLDRFVRVFDTLNRNTMQTTSERDQNRYTFNLMRTLIGAANAQAQITKSDVIATATKRENVADYVNVSKRVMSETTADRQSGIAVFVLEILGFLTRVKSASGAVEYHVNRKNSTYRKAVKLIAENK